MLKFPGLLVLTICLIRCGQDRSNVNFRAVIADSLALPSQIYLFEAMPKVTSQLNLPSIREGVDSLEYRLWLNGGSGDVINLIIIRYKNPDWLISETTVWSHIPKYEFKWNDSINQLLQTVVDSTHTRILKPDISITKFLDSLRYFNLQEAPPGPKVIGSVALSTDSWRHVFEVADKRNYRMIFSQATNWITDATMSSRTKGLKIFMIASLVVVTIILNLRLVQVPYSSIKG